MKFETHEHIAEVTTMSQEGQKAQKQKGFTLIEIVVALSIVMMLLIFLVPGLFQSQEDSKVQAAQTQIMKDFPSAILRVKTMARTCASITTAKLVARGIPAQTPWESNWSVTAATATAVTISYPTGISDASILTDVASGLPKYPADKSSNITSATASSGNLVIVFSCN
jgi:prepilin-type N-terminal cleavage/methylation domain-containing protein